VLLSIRSDSRTCIFCPYTHARLFVYTHMYTPHTHTYTQKRVYAHRSTCCILQLGISTVYVLPTLAMYHFRELRAIAGKRNERLRLSGCFLSVCYKTAVFESCEFRYRANAPSSKLHVDVELKRRGATGKRFPASAMSIKSWSDSAASFSLYLSLRSSRRTMRSDIYINNISIKIR